MRHHAAGKPGTSKAAPPPVARSGPEAPEACHPARPPMNRPFEFTGRIRSFKYAFRGIGIMIRSQHNAWIHALATALVIGAGLFVHLARLEWNWILLAIMAVWTAEALNTAFEFLADATNPTFHPLIGKAKDVAAGAVLIAALGSAAIGVMILGPHLLEAMK